MVNKCILVSTDPAATRGTSVSESKDNKVILTVSIMCGLNLSRVMTWLQVQPTRFHTFTVLSLEQATTHNTPVTDRMMSTPVTE